MSDIDHFKQSTADPRNVDSRILFATADEALYPAKAQGRNRVVVDAS